MFLHLARISIVVACMSGVSWIATNLRGVHTAVCVTAVLLVAILGLYFSEKKL